MQKLTDPFPMLALLASGLAQPEATTRGQMGTRSKRDAAAATAKRKAQRAARKRQRR